MPCATRRARGRPNSTVKCDCCGRPESLVHILQVCPRTWGDRIKRHVAIVLYLVRIFTKWKCVHFCEPRIVTAEGVRKPDLIVCKNNICFILDVTIVADNADLDAAHDQKICYYNRVEIKSWARQATDCQLVELGAIAFNRRGVLAPKSHDLLLRLGVPKYQITIMIVKVLEGSYYSWLTFQKSTYRSVRTGIL